MLALNLGIRGTLLWRNALSKGSFLSGESELLNRQEIDNLSDQELIARTLAGQKRAFEIIVRRYQKLVYNLVYQMLQNHEAAADLTQETFIKAFKHLSSFRSNASFKPWLLKIASNSTLNYIRDSKGRYFDSLEELLEESPHKEPASNESVESEVELRFSQAMLQDALKRLSPRHRQVFFLRYQQDLPYCEIAAIVDETESSIKSLLFRIREKLRKMLLEEQKVEN